VLTPAWLTHFASLPRHPSTLTSRACTALQSCASRPTAEPFDSRGACTPRVAPYLDMAFLFLNFPSHGRPSSTGMPLIWLARGLLSASHGHFGESLVNQSTLASFATMTLMNFYIQNITYVSCICFRKPPMKIPPLYKSNQCSFPW
jgi:hypothetical protein